MKFGGSAPAVDGRVGRQYVEEMLPVHCSSCIPSRRCVYLGAILLVLALFGFGGCASSSGVNVPTFIPPTPKPRETAVVERRPIEEWVEARGYVASEREENLYFPVSGYLQSVDVKGGERIQAGDPIAVLDAWELERIMASAELELQVMPLRQAANPNPTDIEKQIYALQYDHWEDYVERLRERFMQTRLMAPFDGVLYGLDVKAGTHVEPYAMIGVLVDPDALNVTALVPDTYRGQVVAGMPVSVTLHVNPTVAWPATVSDVSTNLSTSQGGTFFEATVDFVSPDEVPASYQMVCTARILIGSGPEALFLPAEALTWEGTKTYVDVEENGQTVRREVQVGQRVDDSMEITAGLEEGQIVILPEP